MLIDVDVKEEICWVIVLFYLFLCLFENFHNTKVILKFKFIPVQLKLWINTQHFLIITSEK